MFSVILKRKDKKISEYYGNSIRAAKAMLIVALDCFNSFVTLKKVDIDLLISAINVDDSLKQNINDIFSLEINEFKEDLNKNKTKKELKNET